MALPINYWSAVKRALKGATHRLKCNSKLCMQLRITCITIVALGLMYWLMHTRWVQSLEQSYQRGYTAGKQTEALASEQALRAMQSAYDVTIQAIEVKHLKEMEQLNAVKKEEQDRVQHWNTYSGIGGRNHECINAKQLQELRESTQRTR